MLCYFWFGVIDNSPALKPTLGYGWWAGYVWTHTKSITRAQGHHKMDDSCQSGSFITTVSTIIVHFNTLNVTLIVCGCFQQTQDVKSTLFQRWTSVVKGGPTLNQRWFNVLCLLGYDRWCWLTMSHPIPNYIHLLWQMTSLNGIPSPSFIAQHVVRHQITCRDAWLYTLK